MARRRILWLLSTFLLPPLVIVGGVLFIVLNSERGGPVSLSQIPPAKVVVREVAPDQKEIQLDWSIYPDVPREHCFEHVSIAATVHREDGSEADGADLIALWGPWFGERSRTQGDFDVLSIDPCEPGWPRVFAQLEGAGAAELPCRKEIDQQGDLGFRCDGKLDPHASLKLPEPPHCPANDPLRPFMDHFVPGACLGMEPVMLSRLGYPIIHLSSADSETFEPWPARDFPAARFEVSRHGRADSFTVRMSDDEARRHTKEMVALLEQSLGPGTKDALPPPLCVAGDDHVRWTFGSAERGAFALLELETTSCEALKHIKEARLRVWKAGTPAPMRPY